MWCGKEKKGASGVEGVGLGEKWIGDELISVEKGGTTLGVLVGKRGFKKGVLGALVGNGDQADGVFGRSSSNVVVGAGIIEGKGWGVVDKTWGKAVGRAG